MIHLFLLTSFLGITFCVFPLLFLDVKVLVLMMKKSNLEKEEEEQDSILAWIRTCWRYAQEVVGEGGRGAVRCVR